MKITCSRRDDVLKRKAKYEADVAEYEKRRAGYRQAYAEAEDAVTAPIKARLERKLGRYPALTFEIDVRRSWNSIDENGNNRGVDIYIRCNDRNKFDENVALAWSYDIKLDSNGQIIKESSSWSGLSATTPEQMDSLRQTVSALDYLNDEDWEELVMVQLPDYGDYYNKDDKEPEREDWSSQLAEATLADILGTGQFVKVYNWESSPYKGKYVWISPIRETPAMYVAYVASDWTISTARDQHNAQAIEAIRSDRYDYRIKKSSLRVVDPIEVIDPATL